MELSDVTSLASLHHAHDRHKSQVPGVAQDHKCLALNHKRMHVCCAESSADRIVCWCNSPDTGWQERAMGATLSVTFIGVTVLWVGALALLVEKLAF